MIWIVIAILVLAALVVGFYPTFVRHYELKKARRPSSSHEQSGFEAQEGAESASHAYGDQQEPSLVASLPLTGNAEHPSDLLGHLADVDPALIEEHEREHQLADLIREQALKAAKEAARAPLEMPRLHEEKTWKALVQESYQKRTKPSVVSVPLKEPTPVISESAPAVVAEEPVIFEEREDITVQTLSNTPEPVLETLEIATDMPHEISGQGERPYLSNSQYIRVPESSMTWSKVTHQDEDRSILSVYIMAARSKTYSGDILVGILKHLGLQFNHQNIFEYRDEKESEPLFYAASAMKPGVFDLKRLEEMKSQGLAFFMDCSKLAAPKKAFLKMLEIAHLVSAQLKADLLDARRERLTESGIAEYLATLKAIEVSRQYE